MDNSLIKRQDAIDATWFEPSYTDPLNVLTEVRDRLKALPSAQPERKKGKWKRKIVDNGFNANWKCSGCGFEVMLESVYNFCPNCGADMRGEQNDKG